MSEWRHRETTRNVAGPGWPDVATRCESCDAPFPCDAERMRLRAEALTEALRRLSDVGWVLARITPAGDRIAPPDDAWHDLDGALEHARAALEAVQ